MSHEPIRPEDGRGSAELDKQMTATSRHLPDNSTSPLVSICIPTFNAVRWILVCLESALAQTYPHLEVLIIDDGSTDETVELIRSVDDERIRLLVNEQNIGLARNWNKCVEMSRGNFIKFLFHDDILYPECVERMMRLLLSNENVGLVFSPRDVIVEGDPEAELTKSWLQNCRLRGNWIGEPSSVLIRKECFTRLGLFNPSLYQVCDIEMWLRIMFSYDIGFLPEKLTAFRFHSDSTSFRNIATRRNFLDQLWLLESLSNCNSIISAHPEIERIRALELLRLAKAFLLHPLAIGRWLRTDPLTRQGIRYLPKWTNSAATYSLRKLLRLENRAR